MAVSQLAYTQATLNQNFIDAETDLDEVLGFIALNALGQRTASELELNSVKTFVISSCSFKDREKEQEVVESKLNELFSESNKENSFLIIQQLNASLSVCQSKMAFSQQAVTSLVPRQECFEVKLDLTESSKSYSVLFSEEGEQASESTNALPVQFGDKTYFVVFHPLSNTAKRPQATLMLFFEQQSSNEDQVDSVFTEKPWRSNNPIYKELNVLKAQNIKLLRDEFEKEEYKLLRTFNFGSVTRLWHNLDEDNLRAFFWRLELKENCQLTLLRRAVHKGSLKHVHQVLVNIAGQDQLRSLNPLHCFNYETASYFKRLSDWTEKVDEYNTNLNLIKAEALKFGAALIKQNMKPPIQEYKVTAV